MPGGFPGPGFHVGVMGAGSLLWLLGGGSHNGSQNMGDLLLFSCQIAHDGKGSIFVFQEFCSSIKKTFYLAAKLGTRLSFYAV